ncbi:hypothetical protein E2986_02243 [Frieseomelitta varia]|uniref:Protein Spindly n=1 Tax=Frieseomelitta varia TaxID=561572 RepID=A0A833RRL7_9HYME|nr:protein Spindly-like [Frieseomelitta varia]KAF3421560.1 hypothetical protein E2986_02243 [Frieseomelitta varia]
MSTGDSTNEKYNGEYIEDPGSELDQDRSYNLLKVEHERCKQEIYDLKRKLQLNEAMLRDVNEANESLERLFNQRMSENEQLMCQVKEKHRTLVKEYENTISNLETKSAEQTREIEELRQRADQSATNQCIYIVNHQSADISLNTDDISLKNRIDELLSIQQEERKKYEHAEQSIAELKSRCEHYECYVQGIKEQLDEKDQILEEIRAELALKRSEVESLRTDPTRESCKGNSLFAEVEDRRQNVVSKMNALREKYAELKRTCKLQIAEIKSLRTQRAAILRKLENDAHYTLTENMELVQKYKNRISDLENKLKSEIKRNREFDSNCSDASFRYFQSLLDTKKNETVELRIKVEDLCTKLLLQEETKISITKQLHYWRCKASSLEDQIHAVQAKLKLSAANDAEHEVLRELKDLTYKCNIDDETTTDEKQSVPNQRSKNSVQPSLNYSFEIKHTDCSIENSERCKAHRQRTDKENCNHSSGTTELKIITPKKSCKFLCNQTTDKNEDKLLAKFPHSTKNATTQESKILPGAAECEYPVIYIPANLNDE